MPEANKLDKSIADIVKKGMDISNKINNELTDSEERIISQEEFEKILKEGGLMRDSLLEIWEKSNLDLQKMQKDIIKWGNVLLELQGVLDMNAGIA